LFVGIEICPTKFCRPFDFERAARDLDDRTFSVDKRLLESALQRDDVGDEILDEILAGVVDRRLRKRSLAPVISSNNE